jgi:hypothetical protein
MSIEEADMDMVVESGIFEGSLAAGVNVGYQRLGRHQVDDAVHVGRGRQPACLLRAAGQLRGSGSIVESHQMCGEYQPACRT